MIRNIRDQKNTLRLGQRVEDIHVLRIVGIGRVGKGRENGVDDDGEDILRQLSVKYGRGHLNVGYLQLSLDERRIGGAYFQDIDHTRHSPCSYTLVFVGKEIRICKVICKGGKGSRVHLV